jgi:hypothetical protein
MPWPLVGAFLRPCSAFRPRQAGARHQETTLCLWRRFMRQTGYTFFAHIRGIGLEEVYHSHPDCPIARSIETRYRFAGNPLQWPECQYCHLLHTAPASLPGRPVDRD